MNRTLDTEEVVIEREIHDTLLRTQGATKKKVLEVLEKAGRKKGLTLKDAACLLNTREGRLVDEILRTAGEIKKEIYGDRLVLFAPLYISNHCINDCEYCAFHKSNPDARTRLTTEQITEEVGLLIDMGHKRLLVECGEHPDLNTIDFVLDAIRTIYSVRTKSGGRIRRVNVNIAATNVDDYRRLKQAGIGTYQLFQETYHRETYAALHDGPKAVFARQLFAHDNAFHGGIDDVGLGVLFGLYDYRFEVLGLISHARYLEGKFNVGPHTFSVPRLRPARTVDMAAPHPVSDAEFLKIIAVLRLSVPYTGIIISTRESAGLRSRAFEVGVSQASASSATAPGGYGNTGGPGGEGGGRLEQFELDDRRSIERFLEDTVAQELLPSFCTACYRRGRTGEAFMELARPGDIRHFCGPNAILTFKEYLEDYAREGLKTRGLVLLKRYLGEIAQTGLRIETENRLRRIEAGERDLYF